MIPNNYSQTFYCILKFTNGFIAQWTGLEMMIFIVLSNYSDRSIIVIVGYKWYLRNIIQVKGGFFVIKDSVMD